MTIIDALRADDEIQSLRQQYRDIGMIPPPYHQEDYGNRDRYKAEMRKELAKLLKEQTDN